MALETGTFISDLVATNPTGTDPLAFADDHLRLLKSTLKNTFPNVTGAVTKTHAQIDASYDHRVPSGGIIMWSGAATAIPTGWYLCDGANGTPNLRDRFVVGAGGSYGVGATGGSKDAVVIAHSHSVNASGSTGAAGSHSHGVNDPGHSHSIPAGRDTSSGFIGGGGNAFNAFLGSNTGSSGTGISIQAVGDHAHSVSVSGTTSSSGESGTDKNLPPYYALCFIMKA